jgi:hypothetical protein
LAQASPFISFVDVLMPGACIFFKDNLQHKGYYNDAIAKQLQRLKYNVSRGEGVDLLVPFGDKSNVKAIAIQSILATCSVDDHNEQARRLVELNYASTLKTFLVIGRESPDMKRIGALDHYDGIEIVGLMVSEAHESYKMYIKLAPVGSRFGEKPQTDLFVACDRVAKRIEEDILTGLLSIKPAQKLRYVQEKERDWLSINEDGIEDKMDIKNEDEGGQQEQEQEQAHQQQHAVSLFPCEVADCSTGDDLLNKAAEQVLSFRNNIFVYSSKTAKRSVEQRKQSFTGSMDWILPPKTSKRKASRAFCLGRAKVL